MTFNIVCQKYILTLTIYIFCCNSAKDNSDKNEIEKWIIKHFVEVIELRTKMTIKEKTLMPSRLNYLGHWTMWTTSCNNWNVFLSVFTGCELE